MIVNDQNISKHEYIGNSILPYILVDFFTKILGKIKLYKIYENTSKKFLNEKNK